MSDEPDESIYSTQAAAEYLAQQLPEDGDDAYWFQVLTNNRRPERPALHRIPFTRMGRGAFYTLPDLDAFLAFERRRRVGAVKLTGRAAEVVRAYGIGEAGGSSTGRKFEYSVTAQVDGETGEVYGQLIVKSPLMVYRLSANEVRALADELVELADYLAGRPRRNAPTPRKIVL